MADTTIGALPNLADISDDALLVVEFQGAAYSITGAQWKAYAVAAAAGVNKGDPGEPGFSPTVEITAITGGHRLTITDAEGTETADILDGADGADGADGVSPTITITAIAGGHRVTVNDANGETYFDVLNGADGDGAGDMLKSTYDPQGKAQDIFDYVDEKYKNLSDGKDATINGVNALELVAGAGLSGSQSGDTYTLSISSHNQAASTITAGTFAGQVVANASGQTPGTSLLRNSKLVSADTNPTNNGEINWTYG